MLTFVHECVFTLAFLPLQVHSECKEIVKGEQCTLGQHQHFIVPPSIIRKADYPRKGLWEVRTALGLQLQFVNECITRI